MAICPKLAITIYYKQVQTIDTIDVHTYIQIQVQMCARIHRYVCAHIHIKMSMCCHFLLATFVFLPFLVFPTRVFGVLNLDVNLIVNIQEKAVLIKGVANIQE